MNSVILEAHEKISEDHYKISDQSRILHIIQHLKKELGSELKVTLLGIGLGKGIITSISEKKIELKILTAEYPLQKNPLCHTLLIGAIRPQSLKKVLEYGTCLGVKEFIFFEAALCEKSFLDSKVFEQSSLKKHCLLGLEQSAYYCDLPLVSIVKKLDFSWLPKNRYLLSAQGNLGFSSSENNHELCLAIGPERGFTNLEEELFLHEGFKKIKVSKAILRTELACLAALAQIEAIQIKL